MINKLIRKPVETDTQLRSRIKKTKHKSYTIQELKQICDKKDLIIDFSTLTERDGKLYVALIPKP